MDRALISGWYLKDFDFVGIIKAAAASSLGILALMILVLSILGFYFFRKSSDSVKLVVFLTFFVGVVAFGVSIKMEFPDADAVRFETMIAGGEGYESRVGVGSSVYERVTRIFYPQIYISNPNFVDEIIVSSSSGATGTAKGPFDTRLVTLFAPYDPLSTNAYEERMRIQWERIDAKHEDVNQAKSFLLEEARKKTREKLSDNPLFIEVLMRNGDTYKIVVTTKEI
ncbi:MAG: hypothetical protein AAGA96_16335 [Verrucomicrobiota bacterium]